MQRERGPAECGGIRERADGGPVQSHDRDNGERLDLGGGLGGPGLRVQRATALATGCGSRAEIRPRGDRRRQCG
jgi:hypothetical protein